MLTGHRYKLCDYRGFWLLDESFIYSIHSRGRGLVAREGLPRPRPAHAPEPRGVLNEGGSFSSSHGGCSAFRSQGQPRYRPAAALAGNSTSWLYSVSPPICLTASTNTFESGQGRNLLWMWMSLFRIDWWNCIPYHCSWLLGRRNK